MTRDDILVIEYYDQLTPEARVEWRADTFPTADLDDSAAVLAECDRIDAGLKALSLS